MKRIFWSFFKIHWVSLLLFYVAGAVAGILEMPDIPKPPDLAPDTPIMETTDNPEPQPVTQGQFPRLKISEILITGLMRNLSVGVDESSLSAFLEQHAVSTTIAGEEKSFLKQIEILLPKQIEQHNTEAFDALFELEEPFREEGITANMIEYVANLVTYYYRQHGFILAKTYIPEQHVKPNGRVQLLLLVGYLGEVKATHHQKYRSDVFDKAFAKNLRKPVLASEIEEKLLLINDFPGIAVQGYFEPSQKIGETQLNLNVKKETLFSGNVRIDNHGSDNTGEYRIYTDGYWLNPTGIGDQLHVGVLSTFEPSNSLYGSLRYDRPIFYPRTHISVGSSNNAFVSDLSPGVTLVGKSVVFDASIRHTLKRNRVGNQYTSLRFSRVKSDIRTKEPLPGIADDEFDDTVRNLEASFDFDQTLPKHQAFHYGRVNLTYGDFEKGRSVYQDQHPLSLSLDYGVMKFVELPFLKSGSRLHLKFAGQYTDTALPSTSQFSLSGPSKLRGFDVNQYHADLGAYTSIDWVFNGPQLAQGMQIQPYVFTEIGYGDAKDAGLLASLEGADTVPERRGTWALLGDFGLGIRLSYGKGFRANISYARVTTYEKDLGSPIREKMGDLEDRSKWYFDLQYSL